MIWHVLPVNDKKDGVPIEHESRSTCACHPLVKTVESGDLIVIHNSYDHREVIEELLAAVNKI